MMKAQIDRNKIFAFRTSSDFANRFDDLCIRLGYNRSEIVRYALKQFYNSHFNNPELFRKVRQDLY